MESIDLPLGETYAGIEANLYGGKPDGARSALWAARQAFDHLFGVLAPDDKVRESTYWGDGTAEKPKQVTRGERIRYAAAKHVQDPSVANTLAASATHAVDIHDATNQAHKRGSLDEGRARAAVREMMTVLQAWADAVAK